ncbi:MAG: hypothetical protein ACI89U_001756, partial [Gammaproteobacteria bacterium]
GKLTSKFPLSLETLFLDLGFTTKAQRGISSSRAKEMNINSEIHYLDASKNIR